MERNNKELQENNYNLPNTELEDTPTNKRIIDTLNIPEIITATGNVTPERFWMVVMIIIMLGLGLTLFFGGNYLNKQLEKKELEIAKKEEKIDKLTIKLEECPQKALENLRENQEAINALKEDVRRSKEEVKQSNAEKIETLKKLEKINAAL